MLLTITTTHWPATDLGFLLGKHPSRTHEKELGFGTAYVYYPEADEARCTAALLVDVDPVGLVRRPRGAEDFALSQYTNDRPYVASSFMSVAIGRMLGSALGGRSRERPELAGTQIPLEARLPVLPVRGGERLLRALFEPLDYEVEAQRIPLDASFPEWGDSVYYSVVLRASLRLSDLLRHLTVLVPVLDDDKHYWVGEDEIDKLLERGDGWLARHPERDAIAQRYLKHRRALANEALRRLADDEPTPEEDPEQQLREEEELERPLTLDQERRQAVLAVLARVGARQVIDVGCGEGKLLRELVRNRTFERVVGMDVSMQSLDRAASRLRLDEMSDRQRARVELFQGSLTYRDARLQGFDAACAVEVIEHVDASRLSALERVLFEHAQPSCVIVTTPNAEYNVRFPNLPAGHMRHRDHRFEWTREQFRAWATGVAERHGYAVELEPIGPEDPELGAPTQMGVFTR
jgi:3' terminal RNA ribose 2'-O-methyltransferase Hen1